GLARGGGGRPLRTDREAGPGMGSYSGIETGPGAGRLRGHGRVVLHESYPGIESGPGAGRLRGYGRVVLHESSLGIESGPGAEPRNPRAVAAVRSVQGELSLRTLGPLEEDDESFSVTAVLE